MSFITSGTVGQHRNLNILLGDVGAGAPALGGNFVVSGGPAGGVDAAKFSADGVTWATCNRPGGQYLRCVTQNTNGYFANAHGVAGSSNGRLDLATSVLGDTVWSAFQTAVIAGLPLTALTQAGNQSLVCNESVFVFVVADATNSYVLSSPDFVNWTLRATYAVATYGAVNCLKYLNGRFILLFANNAGVNVVWNIVASVSGNAWGVPASINPFPNQNAAASGQADTNSLHYFKGEYYILGNDRRPGRQCISISSDLNSWNSGLSSWAGFSGSPYRATDNGSLLVCSGSNFRFIYRSSDGRNWTESTAPDPGVLTQFNQIKYKNNTFVFVYGSDGYISYSADGVAFTLSGDVIGGSFSSGIIA